MKTAKISTFILALLLPFMFGCLLGPPPYPPTAKQYYLIDFDIKMVDEAQAETKLIQIIQSFAASHNLPQSTTASAQNPHDNTFGVSLPDMLMIGVDTRQHPFRICFAEHMRSNLSWNNRHLTRELVAQIQKSGFSVQPESGKR